MKFQQVMAFFLTSTAAFSMSTTALAADVSSDAPSDTTHISEKQAESAPVFDEKSPEHTLFHEKN